MKYILVIASMVGCFIAAQSFMQIPGEPVGVLRPKLSDYNMYSGTPSNLVPSTAFSLYELSSTLFSDYAEKQRLIGIPAGTRIKAVDNGLPVFPEGTILAKTFYYYNDKRDTSKGRRIIETRIMIKAGAVWNAATYVWNAEQTEAYMASAASTVNIKWIDENGSDKKVAYNIPSAKQCGTCHRSGNAIVPVGPKMSNLNKDVVRDNKKQNQLTYLQNISLLEPTDPAAFSTLPDWKDQSLPLQQRARAYLDINCAHCHNKNGFCATAGFNAGYEIPFDETNIKDKQKRIVRFMRSGRMPLIGASVVHKEGLALIEEYINSLE